MTTNELHVIGTLASWAGWALVLRSAYCASGILFRVPSRTGSEWARGFMLASLLAALFLAIGASLVTSPLSTGARLPVAWPVMPFWGWLCVVGVAMAVVRSLQIGSASLEHERAARLRGAAGWLVVAVVGYALFRSDAEHRLSLLTGGVELSWTVIVVIALIACAAIVAMALAARAASVRGFAKAVATHSALIAGSVVFGIPFLYLLITSFKEDIDMSSPKGIVWIPKRQITVPYFNPQNPLYETVHEGQVVKGVVIGKLHDVAKIDISEPYAIRGTTFETPFSRLKEIPREIPLAWVDWEGARVKGKVVEELEDGRRRVEAIEPREIAGQQRVFERSGVEPIREVGLRWENYPEALQYLPPETNKGLAYLRNTLVIVVLSVIGTILSSSIVAYAFSRMKFPGRNLLFAVLLSTMMLPGAVTLLPQFLIFRSLGWVDTLLPLWVPAFFASAFNVFLLRQFFLTIPMELEDASRIDGCSYFRSFWSVMLPQVKPALAVIGIWTFLGAWNNFMGPLIYINSPENMPLSYGLQLFQSARASEPGYMMAFATMTMIPVLLLFFFAQKYFIEGVTLSGLGGR